MKRIWNKLNKAEKLIYGGILTILVLGYFVAVFTQKPADSTPYQSTIPVAEKTEPKCEVDGGELLGYINAERQKLGVHTLRVHPKLSQSTKLKFDDMVAGKYYGHNRLDGSSFIAFIDQVGWAGYVEEDLTINDMDAETAWESYKASKSHYDSLTNPRFSHVGVYTKCVEYKVKQETGPKIVGDAVGATVTDLTVIHLAE